MTVTYGFYNSVDHDRVYNAEDFGRMFDGVIGDGVFATIGGGLAVTPSSDLESINVVVVDTGKAWFNHTWTINDAPIPIELPSPHISQKRIDAIVLDIDARNNIRANTITYVSGTAAQNPTRPSLINETNHHQYALAYVLRKPNVVQIPANDITNAIGTEETPFITGLIDTIDISAFIEQWRSEFDTWQDGRADEFDAWFEALQTELSGDVAANLQTQINDLYNRFGNILLSCYPVGSIYTSDNSTSPASLFGGSWTRLKGATIVGVDENDTDFATSGITGGSKTVTLTIDQIPSHSHTYRRMTSESQAMAAQGSYAGVRGYQDSQNTGSKGGGLPHDNMPPYYTCYIWRRTA